MADNRPDNKLPRDKPPLPPARFGRSLMWWIVFAIIAVVLMSVLMDSFRRPVELTPGEFWNYARNGCLLYTSPSPRDLSTSRMPSSA